MTNRARQKPKRVVKRAKAKATATPAPATPAIEGERFSLSAFWTDWNASPKWMRWTIGILVAVVLLGIVFH